MSNPVASSDEVIAEAREHFADHCASCHANDGSGNTEMGRGLYPKAPDMRLPATQSLSDAELFYIIENGVRFTGMPGWSTGTKDGETASWHLVHFIRHLPGMSSEEIEQMDTLTPRSRKEVLQQIEEEKFLQGGDVAAPPSSTMQHSGEHK
jgi:mono/diheme cytochrome c family protein